MQRRDVLPARAGTNRQPPAERDDKYALHGRLLLETARTSAATPLDRLLAVSRLAITYLTDILRSSEDPLDVPLLVLGHHYLSHRRLGVCLCNMMQQRHTNTPTAMTKWASKPEHALALALALAMGQLTMPHPRGATHASLHAGEGSTAGSASQQQPPPGPGTAGGGGDMYTAWVQELCTFDAAEGSKAFVGTEVRVSRKSVACVHGARMCVRIHARIFPGR